MRVEYVLTDAERSAVASITYPRRWGLWAVMAVWMLAAIAALVAQSTDRGMTAFLGACVCAVLFVPYLIRPFLFRRQLARIGRGPSHVLFEIDELGVRLYEDGVATAIEGRLFRGFIVKTDIFALDFGSARFVALPRHALSEAQIIQLQAIVSRWSGTAARMQ